MKHGINKINLNECVKPQDNFYEYACGGWMKNNPLQGEYSSFGVFNILAEESRKNVRELIENLSEEPESKEKGSISQKISDLYSMGMDMERRNREGVTPILPIIERIEQFERKDLAETIAWLSYGLDNTFFGFGVGPDPGDSNINMLHVSEAGLGLGDRDYYLEKNETNEKIMIAYKKYIIDLMKLAQYDDADAERIMENVVRIETEYARHKKTREERRDPLKGYNIISTAEFYSKYSNIPFKEIFRLSGLKDTDRLNITSPKYLDFINAYIETLSDRDIKDLMVYGAVSSSLGALDDRFYEVGFEFDKVVSGIEEKRPQWKRAMGMVNSMFGEAIGQLYVKKFFPEENKRYMLRLVDNLRISLHNHIEELSWMSQSTKEKAHEKLDAFKVKIGYPDKWKDYSEIDIDPKRSYQENLLAASEWFTRDNYSKLDKPVDKTEWYMTPQTVNAYYSPQSNEICFPAAILQPPFFDITADDAQNYGAIGVIIGHEMTHGFDDQGRQFDINGNINNWWNEEDETKFNALTDKLVSQFDAIEVAPGVNANGRFTLGENIADQGGLRIALSAYQRHMGNEDGSIIDGFTPLQRFYLSYAGVWANNIRPEEILLRTKSDPHSLSVNRVNATLKNIKEFMRAFSVKEGDAMWRNESDMVVIW